MDSYVKPALREVFDRLASSFSLGLFIGAIIELVGVDIDIWTVMGISYGTAILVPLFRNMGVTDLCKAQREYEAFGEQMIVSRQLILTEIVNEQVKGAL